MAWAEVSALSSNDKTVGASRKTNWGRCGVFRILACEEHVPFCALGSLDLEVER